MTKYFAPVAPPRMLLDLKETGYLGSYHLLLAHDVVAQPKAYKAVFDDLPKATIIMDNSLIELGKPADVETMLTAIETVISDYVVMPDYLGQSLMTLEACRSFVEVIDKTNPHPLMAVPQGTNIEEVMYCAEQLARLNHVCAWGIPRHLTESLGTRLMVTDSLTRAFPQMSIHQLGFSSNLLDDFECTKMPNVMGIDSAMPIWLGLQSKSIESYLVNHPSRPEDYWETAHESNSFVEMNLASTRRRIQP